MIAAQWQCRPARPRTRAAGRKRRLELRLMSDLVGDGYMGLAKQLLYSLLALPNYIFRRGLDWPSRPVFYDIDATCPQLRLLKQNYSVIRDEFELLKHDLDSVPAYQDVDRTQARIARSQHGDDVWRVFFLKAMGREVEASRRLCPKTASAIDHIPNVFQAYFSILEDGKCVPVHSSPYFGYLRYHLAIRIPHMSPPSMRVKDQFHTWRERQDILFDDTWPHEIMNSSREIRVVLIVDIARPLRGTSRLFNRAMSVVIRFTYGYLIAGRAQRHSQGILSRRLMPHASV